MNKETQAAFEQIKANVLDRSLFERERPAFMRKLLPKIAPDFDWENFYFFGSLEVSQKDYYSGAHKDASIILCLSPTTECFDIPLNKLDSLYLDLLSETVLIKEDRFSFFKAGAIGATYDLVKIICPNLKHGTKRHKTIGELIKWFHKECLIDAFIEAQGRFVSLRCNFSSQILSDNDFTKTFYVPTSTTLEEVASFLYLHDRLPTRSEAGKWYREKRSRQVSLEDR